MPVGVQWISPSASATDFAKSVPATARPSPKRADKFGSQTGGPRAVHVEDRKLADTKRQGGMGDRGAGPARSQLNRPVALDVGQAAPEALGEAPPVGVVAVAAAVLEHDGIDRAQLAGIVGQLVQQRDDRLLAGIRHVEPVEAHPLGGGQQLGQGFRTDAKLVDVDQLVDVTNTLLGALALVHGWRTGALDTGPDQAGQEGRLAR